MLNLNPYLYHISKGKSWENKALQKKKIINKIWHCVGISYFIESLNTKKDRIICEKLTTVNDWRQRLCVYCGSFCLFQVHTAVQQSGFKRVKRGYKPLKVENLVPDIVTKESKDPTDPYFPYQWYLKNTGQNGGKAKLDLNVEAAWAQGVTGRNVTTAIMDDGK